MRDIDDFYFEPPAGETMAFVDHPHGPRLAMLRARDAEWRAKVEQALIDGRQQALVQFLEWRGIEDQCVKCGGAGRRAYASTSTWHVGTGGSMVTDDVCDRCWGTGDQTKKGADLRRLQAQVEAAETKLAGIAAAAALAVKNEQWRIAAAEKRGEVAGKREAGAACNLLLEIQARDSFREGEVAGLRAALIEWLRNGHKPHEVTCIESLIALTEALIAKSEKETT